MRSPIPFGKYLLLDRISVGGMAEVYKAKSYGVEGFEKVIAIKRILPSMGEDREFVRMFIDEAKIAGQLSHANICQIFELGRITGQHFIAMEYIWGKDLLQIHNRFRKLGERMTAPMACYIISRVCEGLHYAHKKKDALGRALEIVHRDCSPQNLLISYEGEVKVIDFGIAKAASRSSRTNAGVLKGKFGYMSPEQVRGMPLDRRSDIFAIGTVLYESLTGQRLFLGESDFSTLERVRNADIPSPRTLVPDIPDAVEAIVMKALKREPEDRYQWCGDMNADLRRYLGEQSSAFTNKNLSDWIKKTFSAELDREKELMEEYKKVDRDGTIGGVPIESTPDVPGEMVAVSQPEINADATAIRPVPDPEEDMRRLPAGNNAPEDAPTAVFGEISMDHLEQIRRQMGETREQSSPSMTKPGTNAARERDNRSFASSVTELAALPGMPPTHAPPPASPMHGSETMPAVQPPLKPAVTLSPFNQNPATGPALRAPSGPYPAATAPKPAMAYAETEITPVPEAQVPHTVITRNPLEETPHDAQLQPQPQPPLSNDPRATVRYWGQPGEQQPPMPMAPMPMAQMPMGPGPAPQGPQSPSQSDRFAPQMWSSDPSSPMRYPPTQRHPTMVGGIRQSRLKDIALGISIAAVVVVIIAIGQRVINDKKAPIRPAFVPLETGTLAIVIDSSERVKVEVNGELVGEVQRGNHLTLERPPGSYNVTAKAVSGEPCEKTVTVTAQKVEVVRCEFKNANPDEASLVLRDLKDEHTVFVDDVEVAVSAARNKVVLSPSEPHVVEVKNGDEVLNRFEVNLAEGQSRTEDAIKGKPVAIPPTPTPTPPPTPVVTPPPVEKPIVEKPLTEKPKPIVEKPVTQKPKPVAEKPKGKNGFLVLYSQPSGARVFVDGKDTGRSTPIPPSKALELSPGSHRVTFESGGTKFSYSVTLQSGKAKNMNVTLTK